MGGRSQLPNHNQKYRIQSTKYEIKSHDILSPYPVNITMSIANDVRQQLKRVPQGGVIASRILHALSNDNQQIDKAVSRLYKAEGLLKLRNGLYYRPYRSKFLGDLPPPEKNIIRSLKQQYNAVVSPSGELAAYELGLTHTLPDVVTYESDKRISPIQLSNHTICFNKVESKKLCVSPQSLLIVLKACEFIFKQDSELNSRQENHLRRLFRRFSHTQLNKALPLWPRWIQEKIKALIKLNQRRYITGLSALNIPYDGKQSDWHQRGMLDSKKFQIAGSNYDSAPNLTDEELFDCGPFLKKFDICLGTTLCATTLRAIKDVLFTHIIQKTRYPSFFMLDQFMIDLPGSTIKQATSELKLFGNKAQIELLEYWEHENELE